MRNFNEKELNKAYHTIYNYLGELGIFHAKSGDEYFIMIRSKDIDAFLASHGIRIRSKTEEEK